MAEKVIVRNSITGGMSERSVDGILTGMESKIAITTVGAGTLTAIALISGLIMRTGPIAAYIDTTDTATNILAAMITPEIGDSFDFTVVNGVAFIDTLAAGAGVTLEGITAIAASAVRRYRATVTGIITPAITITGIGAMTA